MMKQPFFKIALIALAVFGALLIYRYRQPRFIAGETAPDFSVRLAEGTTTRLSDLRGKYVLLQFWGSWCGPCRAENPHLAELYDTFHPQGFEVFSVAIDKNKRACLMAIQHDGMRWKYHTLESGEFDGPVAQLYNIHSIPTTFLINPEGVIMGVNWSPDQIGKTLQAALASR